MWPLAVAARADAPPEEFRTSTWIEVPLPVTLAFLASVIVLVAWLTYEAVGCWARRRVRRGNPEVDGLALHADGRSSDALGPVMRFAGALLALTTLGGAAWLMWAEAQEGHSHVRTGVAGLLAVGLLWAARADTGRRAAERAATVTAAVLLGSVITWFAALLLTPVGGFWAEGAFNAILAAAGADEFGTASELHSWSFAITGLTALSWALNAGGLLWAIASAPALRRRVHGDVIGSRQRALVTVIPFAVLALAALIDGAVVAAIVAVLAGGWLTIAVSRSPGSGRPTADANF